MRVLVELFDKDPIKNVLGVCIFEPEIVVYLCDRRDSAFFKESAIYRLLKRRRLKTMPRFYYFDASDPVGIKKVIRAVIHDYPGCVFDFSGGRDLVLFMAGACFHEMHLPGYYLDVAQEQFVNLRGCEHLEPAFAVPDFSVEDIFAMSGATVQGHGHFHPAEVRDGFEDDILAVFEIVRRNTKAWGDFVAWLQTVCSKMPAGQLTLHAPKRIGNNHGSLYANPVLLHHLLEAGVLSRCDVSHKTVDLVFKSPLHKKCLLIEGVWLELYTYILAGQSGVFNDVQTSVVVDWDGVEGGSDNAKNEVDVLLVRGVVPVFISCKMSLPSALALSEIRLLATKFGGENSRAVVVTGGRLGNNFKALQARAADLGIIILDKDIIDSGQLKSSLVHIAQKFQPPKEPRLVNAAMLSPQLRDPAES